ncbi:MAG: hypothetical protein HUU34_22650 [Saprospiraceae bacterium]|jgi:hypothetical protein|nr:hypothetical protein [Saprospiraceae bacterium]
MAAISNIQFKSNRNSFDALRIEMHFEEAEVQKRFLLKTGFRIVGPGKQIGPWQTLFEVIITASSQKMSYDSAPSLSPDSKFQQQIQFNVILMVDVAAVESDLFLLL